MTSSPDIRRGTLVGATAVLLWSTLAALTTLRGDIPPFQLLAMTFTPAFLLGVALWMWEARRDAGFLTGSKRGTGFLTGSSEADSPDKNPVLQAEDLPDKNPVLQRLRLPPAQPFAGQETGEDHDEQRPEVVEQPGLHRRSQAHTHEVGEVVAEQTIDAQRPHRRWPAQPL